MDMYAISIEVDDFETGTLIQKSNVRPNRIFTSDRHIIIKCVGHLKSAKVSEIIDKIVKILGSSPI